MPADEDRRARALLSGGLPTRDERRLVERMAGGERLTREQLALAMAAEIALSRSDPEYGAAVAAVEDSRSESPAQDALSQRAVAGERITVADVDAAGRSDRQRRSVAVARLRLVASRSAGRCDSQPRPLLLARPRPRGRRERRIARVTSSSDSGDGDSEPGNGPARRRSRLSRLVRAVWHWWRSGR